MLCTHMYHGIANNVVGESFLFDARKIHFPFSDRPKMGCFVMQPLNDSFRMVPPHFVKILDHLTWKISQPGYLKPFRSPQAKKTNSYRIGRKWVRFEL